MGNTISNLIDAATQMDPIPLEDLHDSEWKDHNKNFAILNGVSGITSTASSAALIWMILRSHKGLTDTQNRLLLGLCISDFLNLYSKYDAASSYFHFNISPSSHRIMLIRPYFEPALQDPSVDAALPAKI